MVDMNVNNITLNADNLNITDIARVLKEEFLNLREESEFYNEEENKETNVVSSDKKLINTTNNILSDIYEVIINISDIFLNINDNFELLINDIKLTNYERTQEMKSLIPDEDIVDANIEEEGQDINVTMTEEKKKKETGLKESIFGLLALAFGNMVMGMFEGFQKDGIMGLVKSIFNPETLFSSIGNYAVIGATIGSIFPGIGTILGGVVGALFGALKNLIQSGKLDGVFAWFAENWDIMVQKVVDIFIKIYEFVMYDIITPVRIFILENLIKPLTHGILLLQQSMYEVYVAMPMDLLKSGMNLVEKVFNQIKIKFADFVIAFVKKVSWFIPGVGKIAGYFDKMKVSAEENLEKLKKREQQQELDKKNRFEMYEMEHEMVDEGIEKDIQKLKDDKESYFLKKAEEKVKEEMLADKVREIEERKNLKSNGDVNVTQVMTSSQTTMNAISGSRVSN